MKSEKYKIHFSGNGHTRKYYTVFLIVHFSFKQVRFNSVANPYQIPFLGWDLQDSSAGY
jgi:hypothetical protein